MYLKMLAGLDCTFVGCLYPRAFQLIHHAFVLDISDIWAGIIHGASIEATNTAMLRVSVEHRAVLQDLQ